MKLNFKILTLILFSSILTMSCNDDDENEPEPDLITFLCCDENPFENENVDNLDQSLGEINVFPFFTPNGDAYYDVFGIENIEHYPNNSVKLYNLNNDIVYSTENYNYSNNALGWTNSANLESGTYKYKVVIEDEQTFVEYGYVCLVKTAEDGTGYSFSECLPLGSIDPILN